MKGTVLSLEVYALDTSSFSKPKLKKGLLKTENKLKQARWMRRYREDGLEKQK